MRRTLLTCLAGLCYIFALASPSVQPLDGRWEMRQARGFNFYPATVPGTVHTDLMAAGVIEDPYIGFGERSVQWVDKEDWLYRRSFDVDESLLECGHIDLCFDGLDTYADVRLNGEKVLSADNMFRRWRVGVESLLKPRGNVLEVLFHSPVKVDMPKWEAYPEHYDPGNDQSFNGGLLDRKISIFARKAGYHYGWDWGPRIVTSGIWRPVRLEGWSSVRIEDVYYCQQSVSAKKAQLSVELDIISDADVPSASVLVSAEGLKPQVIKTALKKGANRVFVPLTIRKPKLWWTRELGEQYLYAFTAQVLDGNSVLDSRTDRVGIRSIELERKSDAQGCSFRFLLNGVPVFMKGANYIPNDIFLPRVGKREYERVVGDAAAAGMNMLRVWGGGVYEDDYFYSLCDEAGVLIWQDFMFSCSIYPYEGEFRRSVLDEAADNVCRLRNHPCIALWCGNNECSEMWYGWGVRTGRPFDETAVAQYRQQYYHDLPAVVDSLCCGVSYTPTSPWSPEDGRNMDPLQADFHYWTPWAQRIPSTAFEEHHSRFYSEYGFQSFAGIETLAQFAPDTCGLDAGSEVIMFHQRGGTVANQRIMNKLADEYTTPSSFSESIYLSQIAQGDIIRRAIESHRRDKPLCWGSLVWQINDCWPVASWSSRDWYGTWKPLHYYMREAFRDVLPSAVIKDGRLEVWLVSDRLKKLEGRLTVRVEDFGGTVYKSESVKASVAPNGSECLWNMALDALPQAPADLLVQMEFVDSKGAIYRNHRLLTSVKEARLPLPSLRWSVKECPGGFEVSVSSDVFAKGVFLNVSGGMLEADSAGKALAGTCTARNFSDNYFDLLPGESRTVRLESPLNEAQFRRALSVRCVVKN